MSSTASRPSDTGEIRNCVQISSFCKRGHLKTEATTFPRVVTVGGRKYRVRECRVCHAFRNHSPGQGKTGRINYSRWLSDKGIVLARQEAESRYEQKDRIAKQAACVRLYDAIEAYRDRYERVRP